MPRPATPPDDREETPEPQPRGGPPVPDTREKAVAEPPAQPGEEMPDRAVSEPPKQIPDEDLDEEPSPGEGAPTPDRAVSDMEEGIEQAQPEPAGGGPPLTMQQRYEMGKMQKEQLGELRAAGATGLSWNQYQAYGKMRDEGLGALSEEEIYSLQTVGVGGRDLYSDWEQAREVREARQLGLVEAETRATMVGGGPRSGRAREVDREVLTPTKPFGEMSRKEYREAEDVWDISRTEYEKAKSFTKARKKGLIEETEEGKYRLTKSPSELSIQEEKTLEKADVMPDVSKAPSQKLYEWSQEAPEGSPKETFGEYYSMVLGTGVETFAGPIGFVESQIGGEQPGEEWFTARQRVTPTTLIEKEDIESPAVKGTVYAGGVGAGILTGAALGAGVGTVAGAATESLSGIGPLSTAGSKISGFVSSHPTAFATGTGAAVGGVEGAKAGSKLAGGAPPIEVLGESAVDIGRIGGFAAGVGPGYKAGRKGVSKIKTGLKTKKPYKDPFHLGERGGTQQQAQQYGGYGSKEKLVQAAESGDVRAQAILRDLINRGIIVEPTGAEVSEIQKLALERFQQTAQAGPTTLTPVGLMHQESAFEKPKVKEPLIREISEEEAVVQEQEELEQVEDIGEVMQRQPKMFQTQKTTQKQKLLFQNLRTEQKTKQKQSLLQQMQKQKQKARQEQGSLFQELRTEQKTKQKQDLLFQDLRMKQGVNQEQDLFQEQKVEEKAKPEQVKLLPPIPMLPGDDDKREKPREKKKGFKDLYRFRFHDLGSMLEGLNEYNEGVEKL